MSTEELMINIGLLVTNALLITVTALDNNAMAKLARLAILVKPSHKATSGKHETR